MSQPLLTYQQTIEYNNGMTPERLEMEIGYTSRDMTQGEVDTLMESISPLIDLDEYDDEHKEIVESLVDQLEIDGVDPRFIMNTIKWSREIVDTVKKEPKMLHPDPSSIMRSYLENNAAFYLRETEDGLEAIGYCRLIPLLDQERSALLGLRDDFPEIYELGTVIVDPDKRESGTGSKTVRALHRINSRDIQEGNRLVIGTTTTHLMMGVLRKMATPIENYQGTTYTRMSHVSEGVEFIGATTCVCDPGDIKGPIPGESSLGMHHGKHACEVRTTDPQPEQLAIDKRFGFNQGRCMMFVSDDQLAYRLNEELRRATTANRMSIEDYTRFIMAEDLEEARQIVENCRINAQNP